MYKLLKSVSVLLIAVLMLLSFAVGQNTQVMASTQTDQFKGIPENEVSEINYAISMGLVPKGMSVQGNVTAKELLTLLTNCINQRKGDPKVLTAGTKNTSAKTVWRQDAALAIYYASRALKLGMPNTDDSPNPTDGTSGIQWASNLYTNWDGEVPFLDGKKTVQYPKIFFAEVFALQQQNVRTGLPVMTTDKNNHFSCTAPMTRKDAILAAYRLYGSIEDKPVYVPVSSATTNTIPRDLLTRKSTLPEISNQKIPAYKGYYMQNKESAIWYLGDGVNRHFQESEVRFLSENGFNFVKVHLGFTALSYPDFPDGKVNQNELKDLDQLIEWGIKYNVHVCIAMAGLPGVPAKTINVLHAAKSPFDLYEDAAQYENGSLVFSDSAKQRLVLQYWQMLAKRYANVPAKFLSFLLIVEPDVSSDAEYTKVFGPVADAIWKENPSRVVFSYAYSNDTALEGLAQKGCAMAWSSYYPSLFNYYGASGLEEINERYPYITQPPQWPELYLPATFDGNKEKDTTLLIRGNFSQGTVGLYADKKYMNPQSSTVLTINAGTKTILSQEVTGKNPQEYTGSVPDGTKEISIKVNEGGWLQYGRIEIKQNGKKTIDLYPHDLFIADYTAPMPVLNVDDNGNVTTVDKDLAVDFNYIYENNIRSSADLAKKHNVGFMVLEWGPFGTISDDSRLKYEGMILDGFSKLGIGWCHQSLLRPDSILFTKNDFKYSLKGDTKNGKYAPLKSDSKYYVNTPLLNLYRQYTMDK
jgi:hypothetical protein